jgi:hypothetical protein
MNRHKVDRINVMPLVAYYKQARKTARSAAKGMTRMWMKINYGALDDARVVFRRYWHVSALAVRMDRKQHELGRRVGPTEAGLLAFLRLAQQGRFEEHTLRSLGWAENALGEMAKAWLRAIEQEKEAISDRVRAHFLHDAADIGWPLFVQVCKDSPEKVAYFASRKQFLRGVFTKTAPGRFLKKFSPSMPDEEIKRVAERYLEEHAVQKPNVSDRQEDFIRAFVDGPNSCMSGTTFFKGHIHPAAVYASGDIEVLWLEKDRRITARCLANKYTRKCTEIYGDQNRMRASLRVAGYTQAENALAGCRILRMEDERGHGYIMPYVDAAIGATRRPLHYSETADARYFELGDAVGESTICGYTHGGVTEGAEEEYEVVCDRCGAHGDIEDGAESEDGRWLCQRCLDEHYVWSGALEAYLSNEDARQCDCCGDYTTMDRTTRVFGGRRVCQRCLLAKYEAAVTGDDWNYDVDYVPKEDAMLCEDNATWYARSYLEGNDDFLWDEDESLRLRYQYEKEKQHVA